MQTLVLTLHVVVCLILVILVLLQAGKEGMGVIFGGGNASVFGSSGAGGLLTKLTAFLAVIFIATSLGYNYMTSTRNTDESTILNVEFETVAPAKAPEAAPAAPAEAPKAPVTEAPKAPATPVAPAAPAAPAEVPAAPASPVAPVEAAPVAPVEAAPVAPVEAAPVAPVEAAPVAPVEAAPASETPAEAPAAQ